ncbi:MAG: sensor histidine kinase [Gemmatimonadota bacterium]
MTSRRPAGDLAEGRGPGGGVAPTGRAAHGSPDSERPFWLRSLIRADSLRAQLLSRLAILVFLALLAIANVLLVWLPAAPSPGRLLLGLVILVVADVIAILVFGDYLLRRTLLQPLDRMVREAEAIAGGDIDRRLQAAGPSEVRRLAHSVNRLADSLISNQLLLAANIRSLEETNRTLNETRTELVRSEKLATVGRLAAGIAHEVGNPLGAILGYVEIARRRGSEGEEWLEEIEQEVGRIDRIVRGLLDFARPKAAGSGPVSLNETVRSSVRLVEMQGRLKRVELHWDLAEEAPIVIGDSTQLEEVVVNLLLNAADAIEAAGRSGRIAVRTRTELFTGPARIRRASRRDDPEGADFSHRRGNAVPPPHRGFEPGTLVGRLELIDNGTGMADEDVERIFEPFFTRKEPGRGTGLGLAVCARLVDGMGGTITAETLAGGGARFCVLLPCAPSSETGAADEERS